ncbi:MAG: alpha-ribazole phosphatase [Anaerolineae bacterium]|jgi:alpha-ribazole phosphatase|nr:alpha-ribazole phosphatase [Anaerolineae bacterium]
MLRLLLIRHGETDWNASGRYQGQMDIPLNEAGIRQAEILGRRLRNESSGRHAPIAALYASDLARARQTAEVVGAACGLASQPEPRLRELSFGEWQGLTYQEIGERDPEALASWNRDRVNGRPPGGESLGAMAARVRGFLDEVCRDYKDGKVALVSHGGTIRIILCVLLGHPLAAYWQFEVDNTAMAEIEFRTLGPVIVRWNDAHHLRELHRQDVF